MHFAANASYYKSWKSGLYKYKPMPAVCLLSGFEYSRTIMLYVEDLTSASLKGKINPRDSKFSAGALKYFFRLASLL